MPGEGIDGIAQRGRASAGPSAQALAGENAEPDLDLIEPAVI
jgi:hypothetical protein